MDYCSLEVMVTLQYGTFVALSEWANVITMKTGCLKWVAKWALVWQLFLDELRKEHPGWRLILHEEWRLFLLECLFHNATTMRNKEWQQHAQRCPTLTKPPWMKETAPEQPSVRNLLWSMDEEILEIAEQVYLGQCEALSSVLPHWHQEQFFGRVSWGARPVPDKSQSWRSHKNRQVSI